MCSDDITYAPFLNPFYTIYTRPKSDRKKKEYENVLIFHWKCDVLWKILVQPFKNRRTRCDTNLKLVDTNSTLSITCIDIADANTNQSYHSVSISNSLFFMLLLEIPTNTSYGNIFIRTCLKSSKYAYFKWILWSVGFHDEAPLNFMSTFLFWCAAWKKSHSSMWIWLCFTCKTQTFDSICPCQSMKSMLPQRIVEQCHRLVWIYSFLYIQHF